MRRWLIVLLLGALAVSACASGSAQGEDTRIVKGALDRTDQRGRTFIYEDVTDTQEVVVRGEEADDLRYRATVSIDGKEMFEGIVSDDAFALRLIDPAAAQPVIDAVTAEDEIVGRALAEGRWAIDYTAAPPIVRQGEGERRTGANPFLDAFYLFQYVDPAIEAAGGITTFNPEGLQYNPQDDPWSEDAERNLEDQGIQRYDLLVPPLPSRSQRGTQQTLPSLRHFRKMVFYLKGRVVVEMKEQIDISDRREFRRAEQGRAAEFYEQLRDAALAGFTQEPIRERRMAYEVESFGDVSVTSPEDTAEVGSLTAALGPQGLGALFEPLPEVRQPGAGGLPEDLPTPGANGGG